MWHRLNGNVLRACCCCCCGCACKRRSRRVVLMVQFEYPRPASTREDLGSASALSDDGETRTGGSRLQARNHDTDR